MIVVSLYSRKYCVGTNDKEYKSFVVREVPKELKEGEEVVTNALYVTENSSKDIKVTLTVTKILKNKMVAFKFKRRKRYQKTTGYSQHVAYFKIKEIN